MDTQEAELVADADARATAYLHTVETRRVFPDQPALKELSLFDEPLPDAGMSGSETLALLDDVGSPATVTTNGPRYFGFVVGVALPAAAAAERLMLAWDQAAALAMTSPTAAKLEGVAARWLLDILDLPRESAVGFGTSATACSLTTLKRLRPGNVEDASDIVRKHGRCRTGGNGARNIRHAAIARSREPRTVRDELRQVGE